MLIYPTEKYDFLPLDYFSAKLGQKSKPGSSTQGGLASFAAYMYPVSCVR